MHTPETPDPEVHRCIDMHVDLQSTAMALKHLLDDRHLQEGILNEFLTCGGVQDPDEVLDKSEFFRESRKDWDEANRSAEENRQHYFDAGWDAARTDMIKLLLQWDIYVDALRECVGATEDETLFRAVTRAMVSKSDASPSEK